MQLANFKVYAAVDLGHLDSEVADDKRGLYHNYQALNTLSTVFSVMFTIFNSLLLTYLIKSRRCIRFMLAFVYVLQFTILLLTNFDFTEVSYLSIATLGVNLGFTVLLVPAFQYVSETLLGELIEEQRYAHRREN